MKMTKASKNGKVKHLSDKQLEQLSIKIDDGQPITKKERELLECYAFDNYYITDNKKYFDANWAYLRGLSDASLMAEIEYCNSIK